VKRNKSRTGSSGYASKQLLFIAVVPPRDVKDRPLAGARQKGNGIPTSLHL
jgi:hypothetical protein